MQLNHLQKFHLTEVAHAACELVGIPLCDMDFDKIKNNVGGSYSFKTHTVNINGKMAAANFEDYNNTVLHEVAHAVDYFRNNKSFRKNKRGRIFHDQVFKDIMWELIRGLETEFDNLGEPSTCHQFDKVVQTRRQRRWEYACACRTHSIATVTHNRIQKGQNRHCIHCETNVKFTGKQL